MLSKALNSRTIAIIEFYSIIRGERPNISTPFLVLQRSTVRLTQMSLHYNSKQKHIFDYTRLQYHSILREIMELNV